MEQSKKTIQAEAVEVEQKKETTLQQSNEVVTDLVDSKPLMLTEDEEKAAKAQLQAKIDALPSELMRDRAYDTYDQFGDRCFLIIAFFDGRKVPGQWPKFKSDVIQINDPEQAMYGYCKTLSGCFNIDEPTNMFEIVYQTKKHRASFKQPPLSPRVTRDALADFGKVFLYDKLIDDNGGESYVPRVRKHF